MVRIIFSLRTTWATLMWTLIRRPMPQILGMISVQVAGDAILYLENTFGKRNIFIDIDRLRAGLKFRTVLEDNSASAR